jgi:tetratricopeptide (TPR) repeat protein
MRTKISLKQAILLGSIIIFLFFGSSFLFFGSVFLLFGNATTRAASESNTAQINPNAFVYILNMGISGNNPQYSVVQYKGLRNGFAIGNGQYILTAAHCVADFENSNQTLLQPMVISPYYGDVFEAEIVAVDEKSDIAILKPAWDAHPALELETLQTWKKRKTLKIIGYPPPPPRRGGNGSISRQIMSEEVALQNINGKDHYEVQVGPVNYPGKGWSGSPFINPKTGKVAGVLCREDYHKKYFLFKQHLISGGSVNSIRQLFNDSNLSYETAQATLSNLELKEQFERILDYLDMVGLDHYKQSKNVVKELCNEMSDSYILHIMTAWALGPAEYEPYCQRAVEISPNSTLAHASYGHYLLSNNKYKKALEQFQDAINLDPNHIFAHHGQLATLAKNDPNAAEVLGLELTERWPENAGFCFEYSRALRAKNKRKEELPIIQKAVELSEDVPHQYQRHLADSLTANKEYDKADEAYTALLKTHECKHCWSAYRSLLVKMGPDKAEEEKEALKKVKSYNQDPNTVSVLYGEN